jgi:hypothetical protein
MAYIGTPVQQALTKVTSQSFNGTGSQTVFTLNRAVNTGEELEVFVNNVQQEPGVGKSYTATGTTLTFDAAPSSGTGNIYVIYRGLAEVTRRLEHDPNAALAATTGTFSGDLTVDTNTLYVDSTNNRVGIGTSSPTATLTLGAGGVGRFYRSDNARYGEVFTDGTAFTLKTSTDPIILNPATGGTRFQNNGSEAARLDASGNLLVGTASTSSPFDGCKIAIDANSSDGIRVRSSGVPMRFIATGTSTFVGSISTTASSTSFNTSSDYRLKENVVADWDATTRLKQLNPVRFNFIADADTTVDGFLAHEVQSVVPEAVTGTHNEVDDEGNPVYQGIDQSKLVPLLVKTIQELEARIAALENA